MKTMFKTLEGVELSLGSCPSFSLQLPIDYNVDKNIFVVLKDDGTYTQGSYTDPSTDTTNRKCECTFLAGTQETALLQSFFWDNVEGYCRFEFVDVFLNGVKNQWQKCKFEFGIDSRESTFDYRLKITLELNE